MAPTRCVALAFDPHRLDHQQSLILAGIHRFAERAPHWRCIFDPGAIWHLPGPYHGLLATGGADTVARSAQAGVPAVFVTWRAFNIGGATRVVENRWTAGRRAGEHLHQRGYRSFAHVGVVQHVPSEIERRELRRWLGGRGLSATTRVLSRRRHRTTPRWESDLGLLRGWLRSVDKPVGILCTLDAVAHTLADIARRLGLRVPQDVGLIGGGNDVPLCELEEPTLTSIEYHYETVGHRGAELLDRLMDGEPRPRRNVLIPPTLVPRGSTDLLGFGDPCVARALDHIAAHLADPIRAADVAAASGLSQRQLTRRLRDARGCTIARAILRSRLDEARRLLETTDLPLAAIAHQTGFADRRALTAAFRAEFCEPPSVYRKRRPS